MAFRTFSRNVRNAVLAGLGLVVGFLTTVEKPISYVAELNSQKITQNKANQNPTKPIFNNFVPEYNSSTKNSLVLDQNHSIAKYTTIIPNLTFGGEVAKAGGNEGSATFWGFVGGGLATYALERGFDKLSKWEILFISLDEDHESWAEVSGRCRRQAGFLEWSNNQKTCFKVQYVLTIKCI
jgi:hypothetical protein